MPNGWSRYCRTSGKRQNATDMTLPYRRQIPCRRQLAGEESCFYAEESLNAARLKQPLKNAQRSNCLWEVMLASRITGGGDGGLRDVSIASHSRAGVFQRFLPRVGMSNEQNQVPTTFLTAENGGLRSKCLGRFGGRDVANTRLWCC